MAAFGQRWILTAEIEQQKRQGAKFLNHGWTRINPERLTPQPRILDCGGNPAEREPRRFCTQPAVRKAVSPLRSSLRCASPRQAATAVQIFVVRARSCGIVLRIYWKLKRADKYTNQPTTIHPLASNGERLG
jgi:hypothetical protein